MLDRGDQRQRSHSPDLVDREESTGIFLEGTVTSPQPVDNLPVSWHRHAACFNTESEVFFPASYNQFTLAAARRYCQVCLVADVCLAYATAIGAGEGIWGGVAPTERRLAQVKARLASSR